MTRQCPGCGAVVTQPARGWRKWCSEQCRKRSYAVACSVDGCDHLCGGVATGSRYCHAHGQEATVSAAQRRSAVYRTQLEHYWNTGMPVREIAQRMGMTNASAQAHIVKLRREGADLPRRKDFSEEGLAAMRAVGQKAAARLHPKTAL